MEHGSFSDHSKSTFSLSDEDHTLANSVRFVLNQDPRVSFCGYSIPHPSDARVNIRVQTTGSSYDCYSAQVSYQASCGTPGISLSPNYGDSAREVLKDACQDLMLMCQHVRSTFDKAFVDYKINNPSKDTSIKK